MIPITQKNYRFLLDLLYNLEKSDKLSKEESAKVLSAVSPISFDWKYCSLYLFWIALALMILSISIVIQNHLLIDIIKDFFVRPNSAKLILFTAAAGIFYLLGIIQSLKKGGGKYFKEGVFCVALGFSIGLMYLAEGYFNLNPNQNDLLILLMGALNGIIGLIYLSFFLWGYFYLSFFYVLLDSSTSLFFLMSLGAVSILLSLIYKSNSRFNPLYNLTRTFGLFCLFIPITNKSSLFPYNQQLSDIEVYLWPSFCAILSSLCIYLGFKWDERGYRNIGILFLLFQIFMWYLHAKNYSLYIAVFFAIVSLTLWYLSSKFRKE